MTAGVDLKEMLAAIPDSPLAALEAAQLERLESLARHIRRPSGSILYEEGEAAVECYVALDGVAEVFKRTEGGGAFILTTAQAGQFFGLDDVIATDGIYQSSARVVAEAKLLAIPREEIASLLESSPAFAAQILSLVADLACSLRARLADFVEKPVSQRLAETLDQLARHHGVPTDNGIRIDMAVTNQKLAEMVGSTPETISTLLRQLKDDGVIERKGQTFVIRRPDQLRASKTD